MIYRLGLDRRTVVLLGVGSLLCGVLIFVVGLLAGLLWARPAATPAGAPAAAAVVAAEAAEPTEAAAPPAPALPEPETIYELQLAAYLAEEDAAPFVATLAERGYAAYVVTDRASSGRTLYTVRIGPFASMEAAAEAAGGAEERLELTPVIRFRPRPAKTAAPAPPPTAPPTASPPVPAAPGAAPATAAGGPSR